MSGYAAADGNSMATPHVVLPRCFVGAPECATATVIIDLRRSRRRPPASFLNGPRGRQEYRAARACPVLDRSRGPAHSRDWVIEYFKSTARSGYR